MSSLSISWLSEAVSLKTQVLDRLGQMSLESRQHSSGPQAWSATQMVCHLVLVEELLVSDWRTAALNSPGLRPSWRGSLVVRMVNAGMRSPIRIPTRSFLEPSGDSELPDLQERWSAARQRLPSTFPSNESSLWIIHPIFGPLSCAQMGSFLVAHLRYHLNHWPRPPEPWASATRNKIS